MSNPSFIYIHMWEIVDLDLPLSVLRAEACRDLDRLAQLSGARLVGVPVWTVSENRLVCRAPARPVGPDEETDLPAVVNGRNTPALVVAEMQRLAARGMTHSEIASTVGADRKTVARYAGRAAA